MNNLIDLEPKVFQIINNLQSEKNINIIYAVDAGSRAYGLNTINSDYDIRIIYVHNHIEKYITPEDFDDCFVYFTDDKYIDVNAWNITKAMKHMRESNPSILEWLESPIIYVNKTNKYGISFKEACKLITNDMHSHLSLMYHYFNMAKQNWNDWIKNKNEVICKKYMYVIRPLISLIYVMDKYKNYQNENLNLELNFEILLSNVKNLISDDIFDVILELVKVKKELINKKEKICPIVELNNWIESIFDHFEKISKNNNSNNIETNIKIDSTIRIFNRLISESKTIIDITNSNGATARSNYLNTIGTTLQLLWLNKNNDNDNKMPEQIKHLIKDLSTELNNNVLNEIKNIICTLNEENKITNINVSMDDIYDAFVTPGLNLLSKEMKCDILELFDQKNKNLIMNPMRKDYTEFAIKNYLDLLWLLCNTEHVQSSRPKDVINIGDDSDTIPKELLIKIKKIILELRPKYIVSKNIVLNEWFTDTIHDFKPKIEKIKKNLVEIRQLNSQKRLNYSVKNVNKQRFNDLINSFVLIH